MGTPTLFAGATHASPPLLSGSSLVGYYKRKLTEEDKRERIRSYADWIRSLWLGGLERNGGVAGLWLTLDNRQKLFL